MSGYHGERGGVTALRATPALQPAQDISRLSIIQGSDRLRHHAITRKAQVPAFPKQPMTMSHVEGQPVTANSPPTIPFPSAETVAQSELLQDAVFPTWKDDSSTDRIETPEEMQRKDPLGTQIWKLYSRTKTRLPNQERMENLTWRMMAMNLKRREKEQALYVERLWLEAWTNKVAERLKRPCPQGRLRDQVGLLSSCEVRSTKARTTIRVTR